MEVLDSRLHRGHSVVGSKSVVGSAAPGSPPPPYRLTTREPPRQPIIRSWPHHNPTTTSLLPPPPHQAALEVFEAGIVIYGLVLSYHTRAIHEAFAEGSWLSMAVYNMAVCATISNLVRFLFDKTGATLALAYPEPGPNLTRNWTKREPNLNRT